MNSTPEEEKPKMSKEEVEKLLLDLIRGVAEDPTGENIPDYREEVENDLYPPVIVHVKLVSGHDVVGEMRPSAIKDDDDSLVLYYPMRLELKPSGESAIRMAMELWSPFDVSPKTHFLWQHVLSYGVVDSTVAEYHKWQWLYQNVYVRPANRQAINTLNLQLASTLSKENLEWKERLKKLKAAGKVIDYPDATQ